MSKVNTEAYQYEQFQASCGLSMWLRVANMGLLVASFTGHYEDLTL